MNIKYFLEVFLQKAGELYGSRGKAEDDGSL